MKLLYPLLLIALSATMLSCDPVFRLRGNVSTMPEIEPSSKVDGSVSQSGEPIEGAKLSPYCPRNGEMEQAYRTAESDAAGKFDVMHIGLLSLDCELRVQKDGFQPETIPVREVCSERRGDQHCATAEFEVELMRRADEQ